MGSRCRGATPRACASFAWARASGWSASSGWRASRPATMQPSPTRARARGRRRRPQQASLCVFNFALGPAMLPTEVLEQVRDELLDWQGSGTSVMEISHRGKAFTDVAHAAEAQLRELLAVPDNYKVLFVQGGATGQFAAVPLNLGRPAFTLDFL